MATVRITQEIRQDVRRKIEGLFNARIKKKLEELNHLDVAMQVFMKRITPEEFTVAQKLNTDVKWVPEISDLFVHITYTGIDGKEKKHSFRVPFKPPVPAPQSFHGYSSSNEKNIVHSSLPCYQPCVDVLLEHDRMVKERDTLRDSIAALLNSCGTLRQVLEKWPTALDFMSDEVKAKHAEKVDPTKKEAKVISEVDDQAKMLLMKARMLNGV
jgi:hypothetical protein